MNSTIHSTATKIKNINLQFNFGDKSYNNFLIDIASTSESLLSFRTEQEIKIYRKYATEGKKGLNLLCNFLQSKNFKAKSTAGDNLDNKLTSSDLMKKKELEEVLEKSTVQNSFRAFIVN